MNIENAPIPIRPPKPPRPWPDRIALIIATGFGSGKLPYAPGTWGSGLALVYGWWILEYHGWQALNAMIALFILLGLWAAHRHAIITGQADAGEVVVDEFVGQWIALLPLATLTLTNQRWLDFALAFLLFRLFDIWKPWPIRMIDRRMKGAMSVMLDDVIAGLMAGIIVAVAGVFLAGMNL